MNAGGPWGGPCHPWHQGLFREQQWFGDSLCLQALGEGLAGLLEDAAVVGTGRLCDQVAFKTGVLLTHRATCHPLLSPDELTCSLLRVMAGHCPVVPL